MRSVSGERTGDAPLPCIYGKEVFGKNEIFKNFYVKVRKVVVYCMAKKSIFHDTFHIEPTTRRT